MNSIESFTNSIVIIYIHHVDGSITQKLKINKLKQQRTKSAHVIMPNSYKQWDCSTIVISSAISVANNLHSKLSDF